MKKMSTNHNGNTEKKTKYRTCSNIFRAISVLAAIFLILTAITNVTGIFDEFDRVEQENNQIDAYNEQIVKSGDQTTPLKGYISANFSPLDLFNNMLPALIIYGVSYYLGKAFKGKADILESGVQGETMVSNSLNRLTDEYETFDNVQINMGDRRAEIDSLVLSKYGIWIIEVKNYKGYIYGDVKDSKWRQDKVSSGGNTYSSEIRNPIKQVDRQLGIFKQILNENGINAYINTAVVFPSATELHVNSDKVYSNNSDLIEDIKSGNKIYFSQKKLDDIKAVLNID